MISRGLLAPRKPAKLECPDDQQASTSNQIIEDAIHINLTAFFELPPVPENQKQNAVRRAHPTGALLNSR
jgi:hypothetical protein